VNEQLLIERLEQEIRKNESLENGLLELQSCIYRFLKELEDIVETLPDEHTITNTRRDS
tara:strand:- start:491 stop:667 length:177 start_codon:yes stop_codon:yes gene_type:complete